MNELSRSGPPTTRVNENVELTLNAVVSANTSTEFVPTLATVHSSVRTYFKEKLHSIQVPNDSNQISVFSLFFSLYSEYCVVKFKRLDRQKLKYESQEVFSMKLLAN